MCLNFCYDIQIIGPEFGVEYGFTLPCISGSGCCCWCNGMRNTLRHLVLIKDYLNAQPYQIIVAENMTQFMTTLHPYANGHL